MYGSVEAVLLLPPSFAAKRVNQKSDYILRMIVGISAIIKDIKDTGEIVSVTSQFNSLMWL